MAGAAAKDGNRAARFRRVLVTGSNGVLGSALSAMRGEYSGTEFVFSTRNDCDLTDGDATTRHVAANRPDAIIHLAALSGGVALSMKHPATLLRDNVLMNINVLEAARLNGVAKTVMTLSSGMYPTDAAIPIGEDSIHAGAPHPSNYSYAFAKRLVEPSVRAYRAEYGMNVIGLVPNGVFGENDNFNFEEASMLPSLLRRFYEGRESGAPLVVWGDGTPLREYTYSRDMARAFMWCLERYDDERILNVGSTEEHSVREIALMIAGLLGIEPSRIVFDASKPAGVRRKSFDTSRFVALSGFAFTPFAEALGRTVEWFRETYEGAKSSLRLYSKVTER